MDKFYALFFAKPQSRQLRKHICNEQNCMQLWAETHFLQGSCATATFGKHPICATNKSHLR